MSAGWEQGCFLVCLFVFFGVVDFEQECQNLGLEGRNATSFADQPGGQLVSTCLVKIHFLPGKTENSGGQSSDTPVLDPQLGFDTG